MTSTNVEEDIITHSYDEIGDDFDGYHNPKPNEPIKRDVTMVDKSDK